MPVQGFGIFQIPDATECERVVTDALNILFRKGKWDFLC